MSNLEPHWSFPVLEHFSVSIRPSSVTALIFREIHIFLILPCIFTLNSLITKGKPRDFGKSCTLCLPIGRFTKLRSILKALISPTKKDPQKTFFPLTQHSPQKSHNPLTFLSQNNYEYLGKPIEILPKIIGTFTDNIGL